MRTWSGLPSGRSRPPRSSGGALAGTWLVARRAFGSSNEVVQLRAELDDERRAREALAVEVAELRAQHG